MIRHVAMFEFEEGVTSDQVDALDNALSTLPDLVDEIRVYAFGRDLDLAGGTWDYVVVADFDTEDGYRTYASHPDHLAVVAGVVKPLVAASRRVQFEI